MAKVVLDAQAGSAEYQVHLNVFEGPLDLLLHLIRIQEMDIYDIPIAQITDQYLKYLQMMKELNVTLAGEFLVMAAMLIYMKSQVLLPSEPGSEAAEESEDPRRELVERLVEHEKYKKAADVLYDRETVELSVWPRGTLEWETEGKEVVAVNLFDLTKAFHQIVERFKEQIVFQIERDAVSLEDKLQEVRLLLKVQPEFFFSFFLQRKISRLHLVVTFFALLELVRLGEIRLSQKGLYEDIRILAC